MAHLLSFLLPHITPLLAPHDSLNYSKKVSSCTTSVLLQYQPPPAHFYSIGKNRVIKALTSLRTIVIVLEEKFHVLKRCIYTTLHSNVEAILLQGR